MVSGLRNDLEVRASLTLAKLAKEKGILTVGIVIPPFCPGDKENFSFVESKVKKLNKLVNSVLLVPTQKIFELTNEPFGAVDQIKGIVYGFIKELVDAVADVGIINLDIEDFKYVFDDGTYSFAGIGIGRGSDRALEAARKVLNSPLLQEACGFDLKRALVKVVVNQDFPMTNGSSSSVMDEAYAAAAAVREKFDIPDFFFAVYNDEELADAFRVFVLLTGHSK